MENSSERIILPQISIHVELSLMSEKHDSWLRLCEERGSRTVMENQCKENPSF